MGLVHIEAISKSLRMIFFGMALLIGMGFSFIQTNATYLTDKQECKQSCEEGLFNCQSTCRDKFGPHYFRYPVCMEACTNGQNSCANICEIKIHSEK